LLSADYSQIELRIMAHLSEDAALIAASSPVTTSTPRPRPGVQRAARAGHPELRAKIKAMNYGCLRPVRLRARQQLRITPDEARGLMDDYFKELAVSRLLA